MLSLVISRNSWYSSGYKISRKGRLKLVPAFGSGIMERGRTLGVTGLLSFVESLTASTGDYSIQSVQLLTQFLN